jgi:hypothetical protein
VVWIQKGVAFPFKIRLDIFLSASGGIRSTAADDEASAECSGLSIIGLTEDRRYDLA